MKKLLTILAVAAALAAVSCTKEREMNGDNGPMASVSFTVNSAELMTKADPGYGKATAIDQLLVQVFNKVGDDFVKLESPEVNITTHPGPTASWTVDMKLAKNETYKIAFWAQKSGNVIYGTDDLSAVTVDYSKVAINNDDADAFCAARLVTVTGSLSQTVYLYRPLAQINIGTNDLAAYKNSVPTAKQNLTATITLPVETPNKLNVIGGPESEGVVKSSITGSSTAEVVFTTAPSYVMSGQNITSSTKSYDYLTMLYVLAAPDKETMTFKAKLNNGTTDVSDLTISNMPYQANYRTNIVGQLLTGSFEYNVEIEEGFADCEKIVSPTFATLAEMNDYLAILKDGTPEGDNGDINPEQVTLTALGDVTGTPQIVLPKINGGVDIRLAFEYDGTVEMVYADPADGAKKPANIFFYAQKLNTLVATVPQSHFELLSGSIVTNKAIVSTNTATFVIQNGAKVGTAEIKKGNASIAGTVETVSVPTGATADGTNAVQVFLEKVSAVDKIELNAKTDVVVEQPKDQIEVEATEKKVAVYVKEGADNSTAKAQNGGVIYVKAEVPCTVTADGTSEAEDGSAVSSTVIIEPGAAGSAVIAENGGAIDLTANGNCSASADGVAEGQGSEPDTPSSITVTEVKDNTIVIDANASEGGEIETTTATEGAVKYYVAKIVGGEKYESLYDAVAAAESGATVEMINNSTETSGFTLTKSLTIDLCNYKVTYDSGTGSVDLGKFPNTRAIKVAGSDAIAVTIENGTIVVGNNVYGPFRIENGNADVVLDKLTLNNSMAYGLGTKIVNAHSVVISNTVVNSVVGGGIEKGCDCPTTLTNVTVNQTEEDTQHPWISTALSTEYGGPLTVESGTYSGKVAAYLFSSGGTMNINGGSFTGNEAAIRVQNNTQEPGWVGPSTINISGGTFVGPLILDAWGNATPVPSSVMNISGGTFTTTSGQGALFQVNGNYSHLTITGGTFSEDPSAYVPEEGYTVTYDSTTQMWTVEEDAVAKIGTKTYGTLAKAFADAQENDEIIVLKNCAVSTNIPVNFPVTLNVAGFTITNNVTGNRMFRVGGEDTMLEIKGGNGKIVIPESNKNSYGFVDLRNQQNVASYGAGLKASNVSFNGATTGGSFFQARTHYQNFLFENVNVDCTDGDGIVYGGYANGLNASIINCYNCQICTVSIKGGTFKYASRGVNYGVFQDYLNASTTLEDVTVISTDGPVNQGMSYSCLIKNCNFANPNNVNAWDWTNTCICAASNKTIVVDGGSYEGNYACYVYTSGGTIHIKGGSFTGRSAALIAQVDNSTYSTASSNIIVDGGTFNGPIKMDQGANCSITINGGSFTAEAGQLFGTIYGTLTITGGTFSQDPSAYVIDGYKVIDNPDANADVYPYKVVAE